MVVARPALCFGPVITSRVPQVASSLARDSYALKGTGTNDGNAAGTAKAFIYAAPAEAVHVSKGAGNTALSPFLALAVEAVRVIVNGAAMLVAEALDGIITGTCR